jgi:hypothetical protein
MTLSGRKRLVVGIANRQSITCGSVGRSDRSPAPGPRTGFKRRPKQTPPATQHDAFTRTLDAYIILQSWLNFKGGWEA